MQRDKWDNKCEKGFQDLKRYLTSPLLLSKLEVAEELYIYLAISNVALSSALIREELRAQLPGSRAGLVFITLGGSMLKMAITLGFKESNNEAEYKALMVDLRMAQDLAIKKLAIHFDSQLITGQTTKEYAAKHPRMTLYLEKVQK
ncbi:uncharacterized protein [Malus domestica]|uniref:uncharacterized protein n=1 Tax=Malus domestica TaxID=3750 RepID=UPI0039765EAD